MILYNSKWLLGDYMILYNSKWVPWEYMILYNSIIILNDF